MFIVSFLFSFALADTGNEWLTKIDQKNALSSAHTVMQLEVIDSKGRSAQRKMEVWQLEDHSRLVRLQEPARLKGIGLLIQDDDNLHLFLPDYPPARRVMNSKRSDAFLGTDFAIDDLARMTYSNQYTADYIGKEEKGHHLQLTSTDDNKQNFDLWCDDDGHIVEIVHYKKDRISRTLTFRDYKDINGVSLAHSVTVKDLLHNQQTNAKLLSASVNIALSPAIFSVSNLESTQ